MPSGNSAVIESKSVRLPDAPSINHGNRTHIASLFVMATTCSVQRVQTLVQVLLYKLNSPEEFFWPIRQISLDSCIIGVPLSIQKIQIVSFELKWRCIFDNFKLVVKM